MHAHERYTPMRYTPIRYTPVRNTPMRCTPEIMLRRDRVPIRDPRACERYMWLAGL